jgi:hypothetical protein
MDETSDATFHNALFKEFIVNGRSKQETYNDELKLRASATRIADVDYLLFGKQLLVDAETAGILTL